MKKRLARWAGAQVIIAVGYSLLAGRPPDLWFAAYMAVLGATTLYAMLILTDELARERFSPPAPGADSLALRWVRLVALAHLLVAAADARWALGPAVPPPVRGAALVAMALAFALVFRAMHENQFFSAVVRIQRERGHRVIDTGPYRVVRHPGYVGMIVGVPMSGLALGSWLAFAAACFYSALILRRVAFEDRFLQGGLEGYGDYTHRVRHRLLPGIW